ncbi:MAG: protein kinase, partial [Anaerolineales bacterium]|nr:protein kinase [Anaerolineales bacterium]
MAIPEQLAQRYAIEKKIGEGAMGEVYLGMDTLTKRPVAVKSLINASGVEQVVRFRREGEALARLNHPNIVKMIDMVVHQGEHFIVMEYVQGGDLRRLMQAQPHLPLDQVLAVALELADALARAHHLNIIHRDIKPANVLLAEDGTPRLSDFGVALFEEGDSAGTNISGTYAYLSPEAFMGQQIDERTDIWAFGVMLFEMLAGERPFTADVITNLLIAILNEPIPDIQTIRPDVSNDLADLLMRMLAKEPDARIPSVRLIGAELEALRKGGAVRSLYAPAWQPAPVPEPETAPVVLPPPFQAPVRAAHFVGREQVVNNVKVHLIGADRPIAALVGMGGSGKSTVAVEVAHQLRSQFADGVLWVDAAISDPMDVLAGWGQAYGFDFDGLADLESRAAAVRSMLAERQALIVLDDV